MTEAPVYNPHSELAENAAKNRAMPGKEKYDLQTKINHGLKQEEHVQIFKILVKSGSKYTTNTSGTYFDLNDLDNETLWKIKQYLNLTLEKLAREKIIEKAEQDKKIAELKLSNRFSKEREAMNEGGRPPEHPSVVNVPCSPYTPNNVPSYDELRTQALYASADNGEMVRSHTMSQAQPQANFGTTFRSNYDPANGQKGPNSHLTHSFVSGGVCITDEDLDTETEIGISEGGDTLDDQNSIFGEDLEDDLEPEDGVDDGESMYDDDPSAMIRNGGQEVPIKPGFEYGFEGPVNDIYENDNLEEDDG